MLHLKQDWTSHSDLLKICMKIGSSWSVQVFRCESDMLAGSSAS